MAAVERFGGRNCILITGGTDRELDYTAWAVSVQKRIPGENLIFLEGSATDKMLCTHQRLCSVTTIMNSSG